RAGWRQRFGAGLPDHRRARLRQERRWHSPHLALRPYPPTRSAQLTLTRPPTRLIYRVVGWDECGWWEHRVSRCGLASDDAVLGGVVGVFLEGVEWEARVRAGSAFTGGGEVQRPGHADIV